MLHYLEIPIATVSKLEKKKGVTKLTRLLRLRGKIFLTGEEQPPKCEKCAKRPATGQDGLCDSCRFDDVLTRIVESK